MKLCSLLLLISAIPTWASCQSTLVAVPHSAVTSIDGDGSRFGIHANGYAYLQTYTSPPFLLRNGWPFDISASGDVVVGDRYIYSIVEGFQFPDVMLYGVNSFGTIAVGSHGNTGLCYIVENGVASRLDGLPGSTGRGDAYDASADGGIIVGGANEDSGRQRAIYWDVQRHLTALPEITGGFVMHSVAYDVSEDGQVIVGNVTVNQIQRPVRWTRSSGVTELGRLPGPLRQATANSISGNGTVIAGHADTGPYYESVIWRQNANPVTLRSILASNGVNIEGWTLDYVYAISKDGCTVVGYGYFQGIMTGYIATIPPRVMPNTCFVPLGYPAESFDVKTLWGNDEGYISVFGDDESLSAEVEARFQIPSSANGLKLSWKSRVERGGVVEGVTLRRVSNGRFETVAGQFASTSDRLSETTIANIRPYVSSNGLLRVRISWKPLNDEDPLQDSWLHLLDSVRGDTIT